MDGCCINGGRYGFLPGDRDTAKGFREWLYDKLRMVTLAGMQSFQGFVECNMTRVAAAEDSGVDVSEFPNRKEETNALASRLLDQYGNMILRIAYSYLHNMSDAEEILQETLIRYLQNAPEFTGPEHEKAWLLRVTANLSKNRIEYNRIRETDELQETLVAKERQDLSFVWEAVKQLPANYREAIHLFYYEGYSTARIAKILDKKESSVRSDLHRGREQLKNILKEAYDFE